MTAALWAALDAAWALLYALTLADSRRSPRRTAALAAVFAAALLPLEADLAMRLSQRAAQITERLHRRLDEDTRARNFAVGTLLKDDPEELADATETGLVVYGGAGTRNLRLYEDERNLLNAELERYEGRVMSDKNAAGVAKVLMEVAEKAAAMAPAENTDSESGPPMVEIAAASETDGQQEVEVDGGTEDA